MTVRYAMSNIMKIRIGPWLLYHVEQWVKI